MPGVEICRHISQPTPMSLEMNVDDSLSNTEMEEQLRNLVPGGLLHYDYRTAAAKAKRLPDHFHVVQWNVERGVQLDRIKDTLRGLKADILILQELDINCRRSGYRNVAKELAEALEMEIYFVCEFEEIDSPLRSPQNAVGPLSQPTQRKETAHGVAGACAGWPQRFHQRHFHGNAILSSTATLRDGTVIPHYVGMDWEKRGTALREPRNGYRSILRCRIEGREREETCMPDLYLYCCHFEIFCGILGRVRQLADVLRDANKIIEEYEGRESQPAFIVGGDLNTVVYGIVRLSKTVANDRMRFLSIGEKESCWVQRNVLSRGMRGISPPEATSSPIGIVRLARAFYDSVLYSDTTYRVVYGFSAEELKAMDNRKLCFYDPGDKKLSVTLDNPRYHGLVKGKLDWLLLSNVRVVPPELADDVICTLHGSGSIITSAAESLRHRQSMADGYLLFNEDYKASDHKGLLLHVVQNCGRPRDTYPTSTAERTTPFAASMVSGLLRVLLWAAAAIVLWVLAKREG